MTHRFRYKHRPLWTPWRLVTATLRTKTCTVCHRQKLRRL